jgi:hypothetical protein
VPGFVVYYLNDCNTYSSEYMVQVNQTILRDFHRRGLAIELY